MPFTFVHEEFMSNMYFVYGLCNVNGGSSRMATVFPEVYIVLQYTQNFGRD